MSKTFLFNTIYVLESLRARDRKTGQAVYADILKRLCEKLGHTSATHIELESRSGLIETLDEINNSIIPNSKFSYIHFEMHGFKNGLELTNGDTITWKDLIVLLRRINISCNNNLFLSIASCYSAYLISEIGNHLNERTPVLGLIGVKDEIGEFDVEVSFQEFFKTLLDTDNLTLAINAINNSIQRKDLFVYMTSNALFSHLLKKHKTQQVQNNILKDIVREYVAKLPDYSESEIEGAAHKWIVEYQGKAIEAIRKKFLFEDG